MKRKIGLAVCIATLGVISIQCSSEDPADDNGTAGAPPVIGGGGNTASAGQPGAGTSNVAGGGTTSVAGSGSGGASAGAAGTAGKAGGGAGSGSGGSPSGGSPSGGASAGTSAGGISGGSAGSPSGGSAGISGGVGGASGGASGGVGGTKAGGGSGGGSAGGGGTAKTFADVQALLGSRCSTGGCHGQGGPHVNFKAANLHMLLTTPLQGTDCPGTTLVDKANPEMSFLVRVVETGAMCGGKSIPQMPKGMMPLKSDEIATLESWITAGAPM